MFIEKMEDLPSLLKTILQPNDVLLTQGAGTVGAIAIELAQNALYL
jgi:UDP-N-acetylmuramate--alanine ligase